MTDALQRTPLYDEHLALGARMVPFAGFEMPVQYAGIIEEHRAVRSSAGVFDVCHMAEFRCFGFGAFDFLQTMFTNDLHKIAELGSAQYTLLLDDDGHIIDDLIVYHTGDLEYLIIANASNREADFAWLKAHAPEDLELVDESDRTALIALQGPKAVAIMTELSGPDWEPPSRFHIREAMIDNAVPSPPRCGACCSRSPRSCRPAWALATPCAWRWGTTSTATTWTAPSTPSAQVWAGCVPPPRPATPVPRRSPRCVLRDRSAS